MKVYGSKWVASYTENKFIVQITTTEGTTNVEFTLEGNILSGNVAIQEEYLLGVETVLVDCIGQLHGYEDGELMTTLNSNEIEDYTVANEGIELKKLNNNKIALKVDINKKIPLVDDSIETYVTVEDLADLKEQISGKGYFQKFKGNIYYAKNDYQDKVIIAVGEIDEMTENSYKSICSILQVMFDSEKVVEYFKENYPSITKESKTFEGIQVSGVGQSLTVGGTKTYKIKSITIDKSIVEAKMKSNANTQENKNDNTTLDSNKVNNKTDDSIVNNITTLPQTGSETNYTLVTLYVLLAVSVFTLIIVNVKGRKTK